MSEAPAWIREIRGALVAQPHFVLCGNVRDAILTVDPLLPPAAAGVDPSGAAPASEATRLAVDAVDALVPWLVRHDGFESVLVAHPLGGLVIAPAGDSAAARARTYLGPKLADLIGAEPLSLESIEALIRRVSDSTAGRVALVIREALRLVPDANSLSPEQHALFSVTAMLARDARPRVGGGTRKVGLFNPVIWMTPGERDLPVWYLADEDRVRVLSVPIPDLGQREAVAGLLARGFGDYRAAATDDASTPSARQRELVLRFTRHTQGMTLNAMRAIASLALGEGLGMEGIEDAARAHRVGVLDNPWRQAHLRDRLRSGEAQINERIVGQRDAVRKSLDILVRSVTGMTAAHASPYATRPRGTLFFAGPTGVGKTELAKQLTQLLFGDENAYVRFDMSEFSEEHTAARLIGAPPGYTGFDAGGELTNALRERPFCLVLFDEIEKAHGRILDKFLQVLEDGRLTDGRGGTVFFTEAVIVFTSNLGIYEIGEDGRRVVTVTPDLPRDEAERRIRRGIERHFIEVLGRPELLNRLGGDIVVFDFIEDSAGRKILELLLANVTRRVAREHGVQLEFAPGARARLEELALANLANGGRGIGTQLESALVNPLARVLFERSPAPGDRLRVRAVRREGRVYELDVE